jgi:hypothetical protein
MSTLILPALPFVIIWSAIQFILFRPEIITFKVIYFHLYMTLFYSIYWFIFNLLFIQIVNGFLKDITSLKTLFVVALAITLFYSINIYLKLLPNLVAVICAYFSIFFTGRYLAHYKDQIINRANIILDNKRYYHSYLAIIIVFYLLGATESYCIQKYTNNDLFNILRFSNIIFSLLLLLPLYKAKDRLQLHIVFSNKVVFLIYLIHPIILFSKDPINHFFKITSNFHGVTYILYDSLYAILAITASFMIGKLLLKNHFINRLLNGELKRSPVSNKHFAEFR